MCDIRAKLCFTKITPILKTFRLMNFQKKVKQEAGQTVWRKEKV